MMFSVVKIGEMCIIEISILLISFIIKVIEVFVSNINIIELNVGFKWV